MISQFGDIRLLLLGNYVYDNQYSMLQYQQMLHDVLVASGIFVESINPPPVFGKLLPGNKWSHYLDKYIVFQLLLKKKLASLNHGTIIHVCDHSNSSYLKGTSNFASVMTCHDLIAIQGAKGFFPGQSIGVLGRHLQRYISNAFYYADCVVCDSYNTRCDLKKLFPSLVADLSVVYPGFNKDLNCIPLEEARKAMVDLSYDVPNKYVLHVGNNAWYKNRIGVLEIFCRYINVYEDLDLHLVLVGDPLDGAQVSYLSDQKATGRVHVYKGLTTKGLEAMYNCAEALIFPSRYEGFGWPPLEAQACNCPVVCSDGGSLHEIVGDSALIARWDDTESHVLNLRQVLKDYEVRRNLVSKGLQNIARFSNEEMVIGLCEIYRRLIASRTN
jgi:glycosyltransferase involved in cell wall biosynthesis